MLLRHPTQPELSPAPKPPSYPPRETPTTVRGGGVGNDEDSGDVERWRARVNKSLCEKKSSDTPR